MEVVQFFLDLLKDPREFIANWIVNLGSVWVYTPLFIIISRRNRLGIRALPTGGLIAFHRGYLRR